MGIFFSELNGFISWELEFQVEHLFSMSNALLSTKLWILCRKLDQCAFVIFSDSKSVLSNLNKRQGKVIPIIVHLQEMIQKIISSQDLQLKMIWVPSHIIIKGNEIAGSTAKPAIYHPITWKVALTVYGLLKLITSTANFLRISKTCVAATNMYVLSFAGHCIPHHFIHPNRKLVNSIFRLRTGHAMN